MATFENPNELKLGRVSTAAPVLRSTAPMPADPNKELIDSLVGIGKTISGAMIQEQKRKEFYEGQERILQASLEGRQQEELKKVLDEQPWYMQVMGPGAVAEGAIQMASKVGAGRMFDEHAARLATGQDDSVHPDEYRKQIMETIRSHRTGDANVDAVFMPQLIAKGQELIGSQVKRNLEHNVKSAQIASVQESNDAITGFRSVLGGQPFVAGVAPENMPEEQQIAYKRLKDSFDPSTKPTLLSDEGWATTKLAIAVAAISDGDTAVYQAIQETGMYNSLTGEQRAQLDAAKDKGHKENSRHMQMWMLNQEAALYEKVLTAKTDADVQDVLKTAQDIYSQYKAAGIEPPANLKDDAAIKQYVFSAIGNKVQYAESEARRMARASELSNKAAADAAEGKQLYTAIINNALADNPGADVFLQNLDGTSGYVQVTEQDRKAAFANVKNMLMGASEDERVAWFKKHGVDNFESLAYKLQVVDDARKTELTQLLRMTVGESSYKRTKDDKQGERIQRVMSIIDRLGNLPRAGIAEYVADEELRKDLNTYLDHVAATNDYMGAWDATFGRDRTVRVDFNQNAIEDLLDKGDVKSMIKESGMDSGVVRAYIKDAAIDNLRSRRAATEEDAVKQAFKKVQESSEVIGPVRVLGVPPEDRIAKRLGYTDQNLVSTLTDAYVRANLPEGSSGYHLDYDPRTRKHFVIPISKDGVYLVNSANPLNYSEVKKLVTDDKLRAKAFAKANAPRHAPAPNNWGNSSDTNVNGL